jgi:hypothetical protein
MYRNQLGADGTTRRIEPVSREGEMASIREVRAALPIDFNADGRTDLIVSSERKGEPPSISFWENRGGDVFADVSARTKHGASAIVPVGLGAVDWDADSNVDVVFVDPKSSNHVGLLRGSGFGRFALSPLSTNAKPFQSATCLCLLDADLNGSWDLMAAGPDGIGLLKTRRKETLKTEIAETAEISDFPAQELLTLDFDNDGFPDVIAGNADGLRCFRGGLDGRFEPASDVLPAGIKPLSCLDVGEFDADGDQDLTFVTTSGTERRVVVLQNEGGNGNNWIDVAVGAAGIGGSVQLRAGIAYPSQVVRAPVVHFGIGQLETVDVVRIVSSAGIPFNIVTPSKNGVVRAQTPPAAQEKK